MLVLAPTAIGQAPTRQLPPFHTDAALPADIVLNADQGLGQCHWLSPQIMAGPLVAWAYDATESASGWVTIEPQAGVFNWDGLDAKVAQARSQGKHIWIQLLTTEGLTPQWARDAGVVLVGSRGGTPVPWNETYQRLLRRAIHAMAARYDDDPTVDAVNIMAGGCYGEMTICAASTDAHAWEQAGYTDVKFSESAKQIIDIYLEENHVWEDGTQSHGFLKTPVVLQLGAGLYGRTTVVIAPVVDYAIPTYGMRVWLKYNGWGGGYDMGWLYSQYEMDTRVGYEPAGNNADFLLNPKKYVLKALEQHASYLCLQAYYLENTDRQWQEARELAARHLGAQVGSLGVTAPNVVEAGQAYLFTTAWENRGALPLIRPQRQGVKDIPSSYDVLISFVDAASNQAVLEFAFTPSVGTTEWFSAQPITVESQIPIPSSVPSGEYDLRIALVNPGVPSQDDPHYFHLVNASLHDGSGRYTVGRIRVLNTVLPSPTSAPTASPTPKTVSTPTPTPTPTPPPGPGGQGDWLSRLLRAIREWLSRMLKVFQ